MSLNTVEPLYKGQVGGGVVLFLEVTKLMYYRYGGSKSPSFRDHYGKWKFRGLQLVKGPEGVDPCYECPGLTSKCWGVPFDLMSLVGRDQFTVCVSPLCISKVADKLLWSHLYFFIFSFNSSLIIALKQRRMVDLKISTTTPTHVTTPTIMRPHPYKYVQTQGSDPLQCTKSMTLYQMQSTLPSLTGCHCYPVPFQDVWTVH